MERGRWIKRVIIGLINLSVLVAYAQVTRLCYEDVDFDKQFDEFLKIKWVKVLMFFYGFFACSFVFFYELFFEDIIENLWVYNRNIQQPPARQVGEVRADEFELLDR